MFIALATFGDKIASLFESSDQFVIFDQSSSNKRESIKSILIKDNSPNDLLNLLKQHNVNTVICGAISGCTRRLLLTNKIQVIPWITGNVESVIEAFMVDQLSSASFVMPGCRGKRRQGYGYFGIGKLHFK